MSKVTWSANMSTRKEPEAIISAFKHILGQSTKKDEIPVPKGTESVLSNRRRREMLEFVVNSPFSTIADISRAIKLSRPAVSWHLYKLYNAGFISIYKEGKTERVYPADFSNDTLLSFFKDIIECDRNFIIRDIIDRPGISVNEICESSGVSRQGVSLSLKKLELRGFIKVIKDGRFRRFYLTLNLHELREISLNQGRLMRKHFIEKLSSDGVEYNIERTTFPKLSVRFGREVGGGRITLNLDALSLIGL